MEREIGIEALVRYGRGRTMEGRLSIFFFCKCGISRGSFILLLPWATRLVMIQ